MSFTSIKNMKSGKKAPENQEPLLEYINKQCHSIKQPLQAILGNIELLQIKYHFKNETEEIINTIFDETVRLSDIVANMQSFIGQKIKTQKNGNAVSRVP